MSWVRGFLQSSGRRARIKKSERGSGVSHYIWRSADDSKVRSSHAERDDRVFSWDHRFPDGSPGDAHNCRCYAEPAVVNGQLILSGRLVLPDLSARIADARGRGLAQAAEDALVGTVAATYDLLRFSYLGYRQLFGVITDEEETERLAARQNILDALDRLGQRTRTTFEVTLPIEDVLGPNFENAVEGVRPPWKCQESDGDTSG